MEMKGLNKERFLSSRFSKSTQTMNFFAITAIIIILTKRIIIQQLIKKTNINYVIILS